MQKIRILIFPMLQAVNRGPKKLSHPYKCAGNVLHSCEQMSWMSQMSALQRDPLRNNSHRTTEEQIKHSWTSFTNKPMYFCNNPGQIKINQALSWRSTNVLMVTRHSVALGAVTDTWSYAISQGGIHPASQTRNPLLGLCSLNTNAATLWWIKLMLENEFTCSHHRGTVFSFCLLTSAKTNMHDKTK